MLSLGTGRTAWGLDSPRGSDWHTRAACADRVVLDAARLDAEDWIVKEAPTRYNKAAAKVCRRICPVKDNCLAWYENQPPQRRTSVIAGGLHFNADGAPHRIGDPRDMPAGDWINGGPDDLLTTTQAGYIADAAARTIVDAICTGTLPAHRAGNRHWRIRRADLQAWLARIED